jgi:hypothetical protein
MLHRDKFQYLFLLLCIVTFNGRELRYAYDNLPLLEP